MSILSGVEREVRYAIRSLRRSPAFVVIAATTLGIGIGGATAIFTIINAALLRPLPGVVEPDRLISPERVQPGLGLGESSYPDFIDFRTQAKSLAGLAAFDGTSMSIDDRAGPARAWIGYTSDNFFDVLGVRPALGRLFVSSDSVESSNANPPMVLGYRLWQRRYAGDPRIVGSPLKLNGKFFTVVGIAPKGFLGAIRLQAMDAWIPLTTVQAATHGLSDDILQRRFALWLRLVGRLAPGKTVADAQLELSTIADRLGQAYPQNKGHGIRVFAGAGMDESEREATNRLPRLLAVAIAVLLLIACANVANLSLVRASAKQRELAMRLALGASRAALVRQLAIEGSVLAACAAALGVLVAQALVHSATIVGTIVSMDALDLRPDGRVLGAAIGAAVLTAVLISLLPALQVSHTRLAILIKDGSGGAVGRRSRPQRTLVVAQVAASLVLLASAGVIYGAFQRTLNVSLGFDPRGLSYAFADVRAAGLDTARSHAYFRALISNGAAAASAGSEAGVAEVALASTVPPQLYSSSIPLFRRGEEPPIEKLAGHEFEFGPRVRTDVISPNLFDVMRIPLERGRRFSSYDDERSPLVAIVNRRLANQMWPNQNPIGKYVAWQTLARPHAYLEIVGVVADTRDASLSSDPPPVLYVPFTQLPPYNLFVFARGRGNALPSAKAFRALGAAVDPSVAILDGGTLEEHISEEVQPQRVAAAWIGVFGFIALLLASIGLYGVVAQTVLQRTRELAVRAALGATPAGVLALILNDGLRLAIGGAIVGGLGLIGALRLVRHYFPSVGMFDPGAVSVATLALAVAMFAACYLPARRAARLNPVDALRSD